MKRILIVISLVLLLTNSLLAQNSNLSQQQNHLFSLFFSEALKNRLQGNYQKSVEMYINCLKLDEKSSAVPYELAKILRSSNDIENANKFIDMALANSESKNKFYIELAVDIKLQMQKYDEVIALLDDLISIDNQDVKSYLLAFNISVELQKYHKALDYLDKIPSSEQVEDYVLPSRYDVLMKMGEKRKAFKLINSKYKAHPNNAKYNFYMADYYLRVNDINHGIVMLKNAIDCEGGDIYNFDMASLMFKLQRMTSFQVYSMNGFKSSNVDSNTKFDKIVYSLSNQNNLPETFDSKSFFTQILDTLIIQYPDDEKFYSLYSQYCTQNNDIQKSTTLYEILYSVTGSMSVDSWRDYLLKLSALSQTEDVYKYSNIALSKYPDEPLILLLNGDYHLMNKNYSQSLPPLRHAYEVLSSINNQQANNLMVAVLNDLATAYFYLDSASTSFAYFEQILSIDQYNVSALNNYSYYLSLKNIDLDKAEQMSRKTIDIDPGNPTYLDTYAWVLFKKRNYNEALFIIERAIDAVDSSNPSAEIYDHYGDILFMNGNIDKAVDYWQKSIDIEASDIIKRKIDEKRIVE